MKVKRMTNDWQSVGRKLPLLTTVLLAVAVVAIAGMAYREMRRSLVIAAGARVVNASQRLATAFGDRSERLRREGTPLTRDSVLVDALLRSDSASVAAARRKLEAARKAGSLTLSIEGWNKRGERVLVVGKPLGRPITFEEVRTGALASPAAPLSVVHDTVLSEARIPVLHAGDTVGFIRSLSIPSSATDKQLIDGLIGAQAKLLFGNTAGDVWTDLIKRVDAPSHTSALGRVVRSTDASGTGWIGTTVAVPHTPWLIWLGLPESVVSAQTHAFLLRLSLVALIVIALGGFGASILSRHIVAPLTDVTHAAETLAKGDYTTRVAVKRQDEVGRLATVFNDMAGAIQTASLDLENQAVELETQQIELEETNEELRKNIAELTNARASAERSEGRATAIVAGATDAVITADQDGVIVEFNPAAERTFGYTAAQIIGQRIDRLIPAIDTSEDHDALARFAQTRRPRLAGVREELNAVRADGRYFAVELAITRIPVPGPPMFTCFIRDLSERKQLEAQLQQSQKMEAVGRLAGGVAHDFNNMLTVIISYADLVLGDGDAPDTVRNDIMQVRAAADRASMLTRQLLAFSRKQVLRPAVLDLNTVVEDVSKMLSRVVPENIRLETELGVDIDEIYVDRGQLEQVLMNLAVNARDAMPEGGSLIIETSSAELDEAYVALHSGGTPGPHAVLTVRDTGIGMDAVTRERIFEPFFTTKAMGHGTGLGLATVYGIVRQSGGGIYVYSEPGLGTTFKVYFPAYTGADASANEAAAPVIDPNGPARVLLVEDDPAVREATRIVLTRLGHEVVPAPDVAVALEVLRSRNEQIDVVLTDAVMPGQSGLDLAEILSTERPDLPVILMSGYTEEAVSGGRSTRGVVFIEKPFTGQVIARALADVRMAVSSTV